MRLRRCFNVVYMKVLTDDNFTTIIVPVIVMKVLTDDNFTTIIVPVIVVKLSSTYVTTESTLHIVRP